MEIDYTKKNRDITKEEHFKNLQLEYISYKFRELLYDEAYGGERFSSICKGKVDKIKSLGLRQCLTSIFDSKKIQEKYLNIFLNENKFPLFQYRDEYQSKVKGYWDRVYYYSTDGLFIYSKTGEECKILVPDVPNFQLTISIINSGKRVTCNITEVYRIFDEDFVEQVFNI